MGTYGVAKIDDLVKDTCAATTRWRFPRKSPPKCAGRGRRAGGRTSSGPHVLKKLDPNFINDPVRLYLREIAETPLLTHEQESDLAMRVENGDLRAASSSSAPTCA